MIANNLTERTRVLLLSAIKSNIVQALADVREDRNDPVVTTEPPKKYFTYDYAITYECPAIFCVVERLQTVNEQFKSNHVNAEVSVSVAAVVEETDGDRLVTKIERYQSALFQILHEVVLEDKARGVKIYSTVDTCEFGPTFIKDQDKKMGRFRREAVLTLKVKHFENLTIT